MSSMRDLTWQSMLDADMASRYWGHIARRYRARETWLKIFLAVTSSGAVAGWALWAAVPAMWKFLSGFSAVVAIGLPILDYSGKVATMVELQGKWSELSGTYDQLWAKYGDDPAGPEGGEISPLKQKEAELAKLGAVLPYDRELVRQCQAEVRRARGLPDPK